MIRSGSYSFKRVLHVYIKNSKVHSSEDSEEWGVSKINSGGHGQGQALVKTSFYQGSLKPAASDEHGEIHCHSERKGL